MTVDPVALQQALMCLNSKYYPAQLSLFDDHRDVCSGEPQDRGGENLTDGPKFAWVSHKHPFVE